jgi:hypothetical protein
VVRTRIGLDSWGAELYSIINVRVPCKQNGNERNHMKGGTAYYPSLPEFPAPEQCSEEDSDGCYRKPRYVTAVKTVIRSWVKVIDRER